MTYTEYLGDDKKVVCHLRATFKAKGLVVSDLISEALPFGRLWPDRASDSDQILWSRSVPGDQLAVGPNKLLNSGFQGQVA
jgi:hypothetical protein